LKVGEAKVNLSRTLTDNTLGMDFRRFLSGQLPLLLPIGGLGTLFLVGLIILLGRSPAQKGFGDQLENGKRVEPESKWTSVGDVWSSVQEKMVSLRKAEQDREALQLENANLRLELESAKMECHTKEAKTYTHQLGLQLSEETGSRVGRLLASIEYKVPSQMLPSQLYTLAISQLNAKDNEKAAVILSSLTGLKGNDSYKTAKNFLMTGLAWYRLENFLLADQYFDDALKTSADQTNASYHSQARLWKALIAKKMNKEVKAQYWLKDLLEHHPNSREVRWTNGHDLKEGAHDTP
jgi:hypothetical protein